MWPAIFSVMPQDQALKSMCLSTMTCVAYVTGTLNDKTAHKIKVAEKAIQRYMLGISLQDRVRNTEIRGVTISHMDIGNRIARLKWRWA